MSLGSLATGALGMSGALNADKPTDRSYFDETQMVMRSKLAQMPELFAGEQQWQPQYQNLALQNYQQLLFGGGSTPRQEQYTDYEEKQVPIYGDGSQGNGDVRLTRPGAGGYQANSITGYSTQRTPVTKTRTVYDQNPEGGGLLDLMGQVGDRFRSEQSKDRSSDLRDASMFAGELPGIYRMANPGGANLVDKLTGSASEQFDRGMSPGELRDVQQAIRSGQSARGVGYGPNDQFDEVYGVGLKSRELQQQNKQNALLAAQLSQNFYGNPFQILNRQGGVGAGAIQQAPMQANAFSGAGPQYFSGETGYGSSLYGQNYSGALQTNLLNAQLAAKYAQMAAEGGDSLSGIGSKQMGFT